MALRALQRMQIFKFRIRFSASGNLAIDNRLVYQYQYHYQYQHHHRKRIDGIWTFLGFCGAGVGIFLEGLPRTFILNPSVPKGTTGLEPAAFGLFSPSETED